MSFEDFCLFIAEFFKISYLGTFTRASACNTSNRTLIKRHRVAAAWAAAARRATELRTSTPEFPPKRPGVGHVANIGYHERVRVSVARGV